MADWLLLPADLLELIVGCFETSLEVVLFRSVCRSWRSIVPSPHDSLCFGIETHIPVFKHMPWFGSDDEYCTLKKIPIYLVSFKTPFGDDYLLAKIHGRKLGKPMSLSSPLARSGDFTTKGNIMLFNTLNTHIVSLCHHYQINMEMGMYSGVRHGFKWEGCSKKVEYLELCTGNCREFRLLADMEGDMMIFSSLEMRWKKILVSREKCRDMVSFKGKFYVVDTESKSGLGLSNNNSPTRKSESSSPPAQQECLLLQQNNITSVQQRQRMKKTKPAGECYDIVLSSRYSLLSLENE